MTSLLVIMVIVLQPDFDVMQSLTVKIILMKRTVSVTIKI